ncbi:MAG: response regulator [Rhodospirillaceae bacterium]
MSASNILIVNDHTAAREGLTALLRGEGFAVTAYASPAQCLADCDFRDIACAIVSHVMEEMTGFELAKVFQTGWLAIPTILLADEFPDRLDRAAAGVVAVLGVSPEPAALVTLLREAGVPSQAAG